MKAIARTVDISKVGMYFMVALRILIGWHFLYEGLIKLGDPTWTAAGYLEQSRYILPGLFHWMAESPGVLSFIDFVNIWGQIFIGLGLMLGLFTRIAAIGGAVLLGMFFLANPPFITNAYSSSLEGHYLFIDKNPIAPA